jgi:hypothetical protein
MVFIPFVLISGNKIGNREQNGYQQDDHGKKPRAGRNDSILSVVITEQEGNRQEWQKHQHGSEGCDAKAPQRTPPAVAKELVIGNEHEEGTCNKSNPAVPVVEEPQQKALSAQKNLQENPLWQRMARITGGEAEYDPRGQNKEGL